MARAWLLLPVLAGAASGADAEKPAAPARFEATDISIGEPIPLPLEPPAAVRAPSPEASSADAPPARAAAVAPTPAVGKGPAPRGLPQAASAVAPTAVPGNGWLGMVVAESATPGRFAVAEVAAGGPAAAGGIVAGDEVRAINGLPMQNGDDVAQALTAIAPGQQVRLAIARGEQVGDVTLEAAARPPTSRNWGAAAAVPADPVPMPEATNPVPAAFAELPPPAAAPAAVTPAAPVAVAPSALAAAPSFAPPPADSAPAADRYGGRRGPAAAPREAAADGAAGPGRGRTALGVRTVPIDPAIQSRFQLPEASGAYVIGVIGELPAAKAGVPPGSVIVALGNRPVRSPDELTRLVTGGPVGKPVTLDYVLPGGTARRADVVLQTLEQPLEAALVGGGEPQATDVPSLQPQPAGTTARRPATSLDDRTAAALLDELHAMRLRIESLERRLTTGRR